jgi:hypothetical protein
MRIGGPLVVSLLKGVVEWVKGVETPFYSPWWESAHWGIRGLNKSNKLIWQLVPLTCLVYQTSLMNASRSPSRPE